MSNTNPATVARTLKAIAYLGGTDYFYDLVDAKRLSDWETEWDVLCARVVDEQLAKYGDFTVNTIKVAE